MDELNDMTLESFKLWSIHALKVFLSHTNKSIDGTFDELSARAFCAWEEKLPVNEKAELAEQRLLHEYKTKLVIDGDVIPDPFALTTGWQGEMAAMEKWPSVYLSDIAIYLNNETPKDIFNRLLNEYKECWEPVITLWGVLFMVENAVKTGETKKSSTSRKSTWNVPKVKTTLNPIKVKDVIWKKGQFTKKPTEVEDEKRKQTLKNNFTPLNKKETKDVKNLRNIRNDLHTLLKNDAPNSCFAQMMDKQRFVAKTATVTLPPSMLDIAKDTNNSDVFLEKLCVTQEQCAALSDATVEQSSCQTWKEQRKGRITASKFQRVSSRVDTLRLKANADQSALVTSVMGTKETHQNVAMKHGISLEPHAKRAYIQQQRKGHKHFKSNGSGILLLSSKPYIAASADLEIECSCCGKGLCEIKCPVSVKETVPSPENVKYLVLDNEMITLDKNMNISFKYKARWLFTVDHFVIFLYIHFMGV